MKLRLWFALGVCFFAVQSWAFGPQGHELIGDIAEKRLEGTPAAAKIKQLLDGLPLGKAALVPDEIKGWDDSDIRELKPIKDLEEHDELEKQVEAFWSKNSGPGASEAHVHHEFHYTDVPVKTFEKYSDGKTGRSSVDIVHMISYCVKVLQSSTDKPNSFAITKPIAVILLAHYVGDIHQPLHVGAEYFDASGDVVNPDTGEAGFPDEGGNTLIVDFDGVKTGTGRFAKKLHGFWDGDAVQEALRHAKAKIHPGNVKRSELIDHFAALDPTGWKLAAGIQPNKWAEAWANEILPIAVEAHQRVEFEEMRPVKHNGETTEHGTAKEKAPSADGKKYLEWSGDVIETEIAKAGWRLAKLLETILQ